MPPKSENQPETFPKDLNEIITNHAGEGEPVVRGANTRVDGIVHEH
jgi:hypothetical protein